MRLYEPFSLKYKKQQNRKQIDKNHKYTKWKSRPTRQNQSKMKQYLCILSVIQLLLSMGPALGCGWYTQWAFIGGNRFSLCQWVCQSQIVACKGWGQCPLHSLIAGTPSGLNLCRPRAHCHSLCEFIYASVLLCLEGTVSVKSFITSKSYDLSVSSSTQIFEPWGEGFDEGIPFRTQCFRISRSLTLPNGCFCVIPYIWQEEVSLMWIEKGTDAWYSGMSLGVILLLCSFSRIIVIRVSFRPKT